MSTDKPTDVTALSAPLAADLAKPVPRVLVRPMGIDDASFVIDSWASSYRFSPIVAHVDPNVYKVEQRARIYRLLQNCTTFVACDPANPTRIWAWVCFAAPVKAGDLPVLHYVLVRPELQRRGIATSLVELVRQSSADPDTQLWMSHWTSPMYNAQHKWHAMYNSYILEAEPVKAKLVGGIAAP